MKQSMSESQLQKTAGGIFINPLTVAIVVRAAQLAAPYVVRGAAAVAGSVGTAVGGSFVD